MSLQPDMRLQEEEFSDSPEDYPLEIAIRKRVNWFEEKIVVYRIPQKNSRMCLSALERGFESVKFLEGTVSKLGAQIDYDTFKKTPSYCLDSGQLKGGSLTVHLIKLPDVKRELEFQVKYKPPWGRDPIPEFRNPRAKEAEYNPYKEAKRLLEKGLTAGNARAIYTAAENECDKKCNLPHENPVATCLRGDGCAILKVKRQAMSLINEK